jgi:malonyl CoA-acyl carrier protein transacylase
MRRRSRDAAKARDSLVRQVTGAVQWEGSMRALIAQGATQFVEAGPGSVLTGLLRQIDRSQSCHNVENEATLQKATASFARSSGIRAARRLGGQAAGYSDQAIPPSRRVKSPASCP